MSTATRRSGWGARFVAGSLACLIGFGLATGPASLARAGEFDIQVGSVAELSGLTAVVDGDGAGVNLRSEPGLASDVIGKVPDGTVVALRVDHLDTVRLDGNRWWPVVADGVYGWMAGAFLAESSAIADVPASGAPATDAPAEVAGSFANGAYVVVNTDDGAGLRIREGATTDDTIMVVKKEGEYLQILDGPVGDGWYLVSDGDITGYAAGQWLDIATGPAVDATLVAEFGAGDWVAVDTDDGAGLNLRAGAGRANGRVGSVSQGSRVTVVDGPVIDGDGQPWYLVDADGVQGWAIGIYFVASSAPEPPAPQPGVATGSMQYPLATYTVTQNFGCSYLGFYSYNAAWGCPLHDGLDLAARAGANLLAADGGTVVAAGWCNCGLGYYVKIDHGNGLATIYGHMLEQPWVAVGQLVALGHEMQSLARVLGGGRGRSHVLPVRKLAALSAEIEEFGVERLARRLQLDFRTADVLIYALELHLGLAQTFQLDRIVVPAEDFEESLLAGMVSPAAAVDRFRREVAQTALNLGRKFKIDTGHAQQVARLAAALFQELQDLHNLGRREALILTAGTLLHETGHLIGSRDHHLHSYYIIRHNEVFGLDQEDTLLAALVARYHRGPVPSIEHPEYQQLDRAQRLVVSKLAALLRVADSLDRGRGQRVGIRRARPGAGRLVLELEGVKDTSAVQLALNRKAGLFSSVFGMDIEVEAAAATTDSPS